MSFEIAQQIPETFTPGDTFLLQISSNDFPTGARAAWQFTLALRGPSKADLTASVSQNAYLFNAAPSATKTWAPGEYFWQLRATATVADSTNTPPIAVGDSTTISKGRITFLFDYAAVTDQNFSDKSQAEQTLDGLFAVLAVKQGTATTAQNVTASSMFTKLYIIDGIRVERADPEQIIKLIEKYQRLVGRERQNDHLNPGKKRKNRVYTRFS